MASTRLRRTFNYPAESEDEDAIEEGMDSKDQETLLTKLSTRDTSSTRLYTRLLLAFPLLPALLYIPRLFSIATVLPSLLAIASLLATAYTLYYLPLPPVRIRVTSMSDAPKTATSKDKPKRRSIARSATGFSSTPVRHETPDVPYISDEASGLLKTWIVPVNAVLCVAFAGWEVWQSRAWSEGFMVGGGSLPGIVMGVIMWARRELRVVDLGELERLRYRAKGT
ncbi:hypothetical protein K504DRAFT_461048 [Pleomassaria siparia CBS 279.74]|uniref:Uncharacterized protein n=1 Tax=Pleomassaria siparia CBS 279.74 TaxID=1314801 RepID=A0A6G1JX13_9PLEO|nr:hypothetical protein K504DRAFT_461048 [Pleomassaria siparia CBS 279.74]